MKTNYQDAGMLDMIFENRNKSYGAYALRSDYNSRISQAMLITLSVIFLLAFGKFISERASDKGTIISCPMGEFHPIPPVVLENKPVEMPKPKPVEAPRPKPIQTQRNTEMKVAASNLASDSIPTVEQLRNIDPGLSTNLNGSTTGVTDGRGDLLSFVPEPDATPLSADPIRIAEVMPVFPGGEAALMRFLSDYTRYPAMEKEMGIGGKVISEFTVNENGKISDVKILRSPSKGFDREVARVVKLMPAFTPGMQQGRPVKVRFVLPFTFHLSD